VITQKSQRLSVFCAIFALFLLTQAPALVAASLANGTISGRVNFCGKGGIEGMQVYIPGKPYVIITDTSGDFKFTHIPDGRYTLAYLYQGNVLNRNMAIEVSESKPALLGEIRFCSQSVAAMPQQATPGAAPVDNQTDPNTIDKDGDGVVAAKDCRDDDPAIRPGAREICDGIDNDCDGKIDNLGLTAVEHGFASCQAGALKLDHCAKNFADCDGDIRNGCEADLNNDNANCGACGNACGLEICALGSC